MVRIGHFADIHHEKVDASTFKTDLQYLWDKGLDSLIWGGDQIVGDEPNVPHSPASNMRAFWNDVEEQLGSAALDEMYAIAGNHDIPYTHHEEIASEYLSRSRVRTPIEIQPVAGVTILLINTQGPAIVQGGGDSVAQDYCRVPYQEIKWLHEKLSDAASRGDIRIVIGHAPIWFGTNPTLESYNPDAPWDDKQDAYLGGSDSSGQAYEIPQNFDMIRQTLEEHTPIVYFCGHDYHGPGFGGSAEEVRVFNDIHHVWQDHYSIGPSTFAYLDADPARGSVTYTTVNSIDHPRRAGHTEQEIINITKSW